MLTAGKSEEVERRQPGSNTHKCTTSQCAWDVARNKSLGALETYDIAATALESIRTECMRGGRNSPTKQLSRA